MKHFLNIVLLATLIIFSTCKEDEDGGMTTTGTIQGKITDASTGSPIEGASVKSLPATSTVNTNSTGEYTISNANAGTYTIIATKGGYVADSIEVSVTANATTKGDIALTPITDPGDSNLPPNKPENISPKPDTVNQSIAPTLEWSGSDPNGDTLTYDILFDTENPPVKLLLSDYDSTAYPVDSLEYETAYYWQVIATDSHGASTAGDVWKFTTMEPNNDPIKPELISPAHEAVDQDTIITLEWKATDPDDDPLTYDILFGTVNPPLDTISFGQDTTTHQVNSLDNLTTYYWQVIAKDDRGGSTVGDVWKFTTEPKNTKPNKPELVSPPDGATDLPTFLTLAWTATDPDGDALTYDVLLDTVELPVDTLLWDHEGVTHQIDTLKNEVTYYWQVIAKDTHGDTTASKVGQFTTKSSSVIIPPYNLDFESENTGWSADNGLWQIGVPTVGPEKAHSGEKVAGTILDDNYPYNANTRLISPDIKLPNLGAGEKIQLKFWHWFRFYTDNGVVQISVDEGKTWDDISSTSFDDVSNTWTQYIADLSAYKGSIVQIAFYFTSDNFGLDNGWYIDDVSIEIKEVPFNNPEDFEIGVGDWYADNGLWQVGDPTIGPEKAHSGEHVAGTILDGNYPYNANTRLISPDIKLPNLATGEKIQLKFWHWFRFYTDNGVVQISVDNGDWEIISNPFDDVSNAWTQYIADLSEYAGKNVRIAFYFTSDNFGLDNGWYIDDVSIEKKVVPFNNPEDFELGMGDWYADNGLWQVGDPTVGPDNTHSGEKVAGTILDDNYPYNANTRLISPDIKLPNLATGEKIQLKFWHWFRFYTDNGVVQISVDNGDWEIISNPFDDVSNAWTLNSTDISEYTGKNVRIAFYFTSDNFGLDNGWYIDDVSIEKK